MKKKTQKDIVSLEQERGEMKKEEKNSIFRYCIVLPSRRREIDREGSKFTSGNRRQTKAERESERFSIVGVRWGCWKCEQTRVSSGKKRAIHIRHMFCCPGEKKTQRLLVQFLTLPLAGPGKGPHC